MKQNRPAPAYQEYASSMLANYNFRSLSLPARGLLYTLRLERWVNKSVPSDIQILAKVLGVPLEGLHELMRALTPFFSVKDEAFYSLELEDYRAYLTGLHEAKSQGGKKGAALTNARFQSPLDQDRDTRQLTRDCLDKPSKGKHSKDQFNSVISKDDDNYSWIRAFDEGG